MGQSLTSLPATVGLTVLIVVFFITIPTALSLYSRVRAKRTEHGYEGIQKLYEDQDGIATEETQKQYSAAVPKYLIFASTISGLLLSIASSVYSTVLPTRNLYTENWLTFGSWSLLIIEVIYLSTERSSVRRYSFGTLGALASTAIFISICVRIGIPISDNDVLIQHDAFVVLDLLQLASAAVCCFACLSLPRRPSLSEKGQAVDGQYTVSAISLYTFSWPSDILNLARTKKTLSLNELPRLHLKGRSAYLQDYFYSVKKRDRLWKSLLFVHYPELLFQTLFTMVQSATQFLPQLAMYQLLKLLEQRSHDAPISRGTWGLVLALGLSIILSSWSMTWIHFIVWTRLGQPIRTELSAMIFTKATRRKDVKGAQKSKPAMDLQKDNINAIAENVSISQKPSKSIPTGTSSPPSLKDGAEDKEEDIQKSRQSTINLIGVDTKRLSDFATFYYFFPKTAAELTVSIIFLIKLIGWKSLLAGLAVFGVVLPLNIYTSKKYSDAQGDLMKVRDQKMVVVTEALQGIRQIKFSAEERQWQEKIGKKRKEELATQWRVFRLDTVLISLWIIGPVMLSAISLAAYAAIYGNLSASVAFTTINVMSSLEVSLAILPELIADSLEAWVSVQRIDEYLNAEENVRYVMPGTNISFENASVAFPKYSQDEDPDRFMLKDVNVSFPTGELSVVSGKTGSGKSLLLAAILGEADKLSGIIRVPIAPEAQDRFDYRANKNDWIIDSAIAFVAQIPWIENASIKDNILFSLPFDSGRYKKVISCCALEKDLEVLPDGEMTDIGANGINLSGGQRWRISFARALYSRAGILILDDIFSAVDAHVGRQLFDDALTGELGKGRTRILVTHHVGLCLPKTKYTVILNEGTVQHEGLVEELRRTGVLDQVMKQEQEDHEKEVTKNDEELQTMDDSTKGTLNKILSNVTERSTKTDRSELDVQGKTQPKQFTEDEKRETGAIKAHIYKEYLGTSGGLPFWLPIMLLYGVYQGLILGRSWFIGFWTRSYATKSLLMQNSLLHDYAFLSGSSRMKIENQDDSNLSFYLGVYLGISIVICMLGTVRYFFVYLGSIRASKRLFERLTYAVLRAPLRWLDITPVGRILNRFTADFAAIDSKLGNDLGFMLYELVQLVGIVIAGLFVSPWMLLIALLLLILCAWITARFLAGAREVKRLESNAKSPLFELFGTSLAGIGTIRAFDKADIYIERMFDKIDQHAKAFWYLWLFNRWVAFRLNVVGACFAILIAAVIVFSGIEASLAGFALSFALQYSNALLWAARCYANVELSMNSVERVSEYSKIPIEQQDASVNVSAAWPQEGRLEVSNLVAGYAPDLPPVLKGLSFRVEKNQRIGVVGRTGAGKSSLTLALFRFLEAREGSIHIDGLDISKISLYDLRSRVAIIPQDPVLFSGTVRSNLDAFDAHSDTELNDALERVHLIRSTGTASREESNALGLSSGSGSNTPALAAADANTNIFKSLSSRISEGGLNLSQGQRQLLCLARAIVSRPKIMVLDEATSAVDMATDVLIQRSIREEFQDSTLLVIAHRLSTIADFDRILVMDDGRAAEFDAPKNLIAKGGIFAGMVEQSGEKQKLHDIIADIEEGNRKGRA